MRASRRPAQSCRLPLGARRDVRSQGEFLLSSGYEPVRGGSGCVAARADRRPARLGRAALDALYPPTCLACRAATGASRRAVPACWRAMRFIERPFCDRLGTPFEQDLGEGLLSPQAIADPPVFRRARAVARFEDGPARRLVHRLKYSDRGELAAPDGRLDGARRRRRAGRGRRDRAGAAASRCGYGRDASIRRPRSPARSRGERQTLRAALAERVKATRSQVGLTREQRAENMQGAFRAARRRADARAADRAGRRRADLGRDRQRRRARAAEGGRGASRPARFRAGCDSGVTSHIVRRSRPYRRNGARDRAADRHLHQVDLPLLPRRQGLVAPQGRAVRGNQRRRRSGRRRRRWRQKAGGRSTVPQIFIGATPRRRLRRSLRARKAGRLDPLLAG